VGGRLRVGDALDPATDIGPIRLERARALVRAATEQFSQAVVFSGRISGGEGYPWVPEMEAVQNLIETRYGFLVAVLGSPPAGGEDLFRQHFGMVLDAPDFLFMSLRIPLGGRKASPHYARDTVARAWRWSCHRATAGART
jgi:hypothetical protein